MQNNPNPQAKKGYAAPKLAKLGSAVELTRGRRIGDYDDELGRYRIWQ